MPQGDEQQQEEVEVIDAYVGPPQVFCLQWSDGRVFNTRRGERRLTRAATTPEMNAAWDLAGRELGEAGFSWEGASQVLFWERAGWDRATLDEVIDSLPDRAAEAEAKAARREQERLEREEREAAEDRERHRVYIEEAREGARVSLHEKRWSWAKGSLIDEANKLINDPALDRAGAKRLNSLVSQATKNVERSEQRIAIAHEPELARAANPAVVAAARDAIASITARDEDWATVVNDVGWSKSTTVDGHVLDGLTEWSVEQASHALRLLRIHHGQVPERCKRGLFAGRPSLFLSSTA